MTDKRSYVEWRTDPISHAMVFSGQVQLRDVAELHLDPIDRAVLNEPIQTAVDLFQNLEILFRRIAQHREKQVDGI